MTTLDGKFDGVIYRRRDNHVEEDFVVFVPRDNLLVETLRYYQWLCLQKGCGLEQAAAVERLIARVEKWRKNYAFECKNPDALPGECP